VYAVVQVYGYRSGSWLPHVVDLGRFDAELPNLDLTGRAVQIGRKRGPRGAQEMEFLKNVSLGSAKPPADQTPINPKPVLLRRYGLYAEAEQAAIEPYYEQARLQFEPPADKLESA
jgi:hypothetical protein